MVTYAKGHVRVPNKDHLIQLSYRRHKLRLQGMKVMAPPSTWDSVAQGWVGEIKDQGNCMPGTDEVLTTKGWVPWQDYDYTTPLGTMNPITGVLEFQPPLKKHVYDYDGPLYYSDSKCLDFALTPEHKLLACNADLGRDGRRGAFVKHCGPSMRDFRFVPVKDIGWRVGLPASTSGWYAGTQLDKVTVGNRQYDGDDFLALVALVISDGYVGHICNGLGNQNRLTFCCFREDRIEMVRALAYRLGIKEAQCQPGTWYWQDGALAEWFRQNAYLEGGFTAVYKHVPDLVKWTSQKQIEHFLRFFGDQSIDKDGARSLFSSSFLMADDLQELLLRVGKRASISKTPPRTSIMQDGRRIQSKESFTLYERRGGMLSLDRKAHLHTDYYKGKVYCATVPNHTLVTRRNKSVLISSNCGSCWTFSGTGVVEIAYNKAGVGGGPASMVLSEEYTLSCGKNGGCGGDDNTTVLDWAKKTGLPTSKDYGPYDATEGRCHYQPNMTLYKIDDWGFADSNGGNGVTSVADIKAAIMAYGCVGSGIAADDAFMNISPGQVFDHTTSHSIDHDIVLVGWDDSKGSKGAWKLRNSWGTSWCSEGYCWIGYNVNDVGSEAVWALVNPSNPPIDILIWTF